VACFASGRWFKAANFGLIPLAIVDNVLIFYTRTFPSAFFRGRIIPWSVSWIPPGAVQVLVGQIVLIILSAILLSKHVAPAGSAASTKQTG
jgi:hypothetical protein